jgi:hypothetical protein
MVVAEPAPDLACGRDDCDIKKVAVKALPRDFFVSSDDVQAAAARSAGQGQELRAKALGERCGAKGCREARSGPKLQPNGRVINRQGNALYGEAVALGRQHEGPAARAAKLQLVELPRTAGQGAPERKPGWTIPAHIKISRRSLGERSIKSPDTGT